MRRLVLVGGGHAHVFVLDALARDPLPGVEVVLVSTFDRHHYSGMVPGFLQGTYREDDLVFDLRALAGRAGARLVVGEARRVDAASRVVELESGETIPFDGASLDVGSDAAGLDVPGARAHALSVRPMTRAIALRERVDAVIRERDEVRVVIAGAGAAGFEVGLALERRIRESRRRARVTLVDPDADVLRGYGQRVRRVARTVLAVRGLSLALGRRISAVDATHVSLDAGPPLEADLCVWLTGAAPGALLRASAIPTSDRGWLRVDATLRAADGSPVWGASDCVELAGEAALPKAGVYAVRESPVLAANLRAFFEGGTARAYAPQRTYLSLLNTADGKALLRWHGIVAHARWAFRLKDRIDRAFMRRYQA